MRYESLFLYLNNKVANGTLYVISVSFSEVLLPAACGNKSAPDIKAHQIKQRIFLSIEKKDMATPIKTFAHPVGYVAIIIGGKRTYF